MKITDQSNRILDQAFRQLVAESATHPIIALAVGWVKEELKKTLLRLHEGDFNILPPPKPDNQEQPHA